MNYFFRRGQNKDEKFSSDAANAVGNASASAVAGANAAAVASTAAVANAAAGVSTAAVAVANAGAVACTATVANAAAGAIGKQTIFQQYFSDLIRRESRHLNVFGYITITIQSI